MTENEVLLRRSGEWTKIPDPVPLPEDKDADFGVLLDKAGFSKFYASGVYVTSLDIEVWQRCESPRFYIVVSNGSDCLEAYADELPDLMELLAEWLPVATHSGVLEVLEHFIRHESVSDLRKWGKPNNALEALVTLIRERA